ncbi:MAG: hypothetical protein ACOX0F_11375 [Syntrophomonadaceae bacterium]|jgi:hypothetical protein
MADSVEGKEKGFSGLSSMVSTVEILSIEAEPAQSRGVSGDTLSASDQEQAQINTGPKRTKQKRSWIWLGEWVVSNASTLIYLLILGVFLYWLSHNSASTSSTPSSSTSKPATSSNSSNPSSMTFEKPSIGTRTFSAANIRWALREQIKLDTIRNHITTNAGINAYNAMIDDYNSRASEYRYYQADMDRAKRDVESIRSQIVSEAIAEARRINR